MKRKEIRERLKLIVKYCKILEQDSGFRDLEESKRRVFYSFGQIKERIRIIDNLLESEEFED